MYDSSKRPTEGRALVAWLRDEAAGYKRLADKDEDPKHRTTATAFSSVCKLLADDLERALDEDGGTPINAVMPRRWLYADPSNSPGLGRPVGMPMYGTYFPGTDLCIYDTGTRRTGKPKGVTWIDPEPNPDLEVQQYPNGFHKHGIWVQFTSEEAKACASDCVPEGDHSCGCDGAVDTGCPWCSEKKAEEWLIGHRKTKTAP